METISGQPETSPSLFNYFLESALPGDRKVQALIQNWKATDFDFQYEIPGYPPRRKGYGSTLEQLEMYAARAGELDNFEWWTLGLIPNSLHQKTIAILRSIEPYYDSLIWNPQLDSFSIQISQLSAYAEEKELSKYLTAIRGFYGSNWSDEMPFVVSLYPIPGHTGNIISTPRSNMLLCGMLVGNSQFDGLMGIALHEIAHTLYQEQPKAFQWQLFEWFDSAASSYGDFAYSYINEALATAIGNGWVYEKLNGSLNQEDWYADHYIDRYAKAIYPIVKQYLEREQTIDEPMVQELVSVFEQTFPFAIFEYQNLFNDFQLFSDVADQQVPRLIEMVQENFRTSSYLISTPILASESLARMEQAQSSTRFFVITQRVRQTLGRLETSIPELKQYQVLFPDRPFMLRFLTADKHAVIIIHSDRELVEFKKGLTFLKEEVRLNVLEPIIWLDD